MNKIFIFLIILCASLNTSAQQTEENSKSKYVLKIYNMSSVTRERIYYNNIGPWNDSYYETRTSTRWAHPTFALQVKTKKNNFHEFELTQLTFDGINIDESNSNLIVKNNYSHVAMRYEFMWNFTKSEKSKLNALLGVGAGPYYNRNRYTSRNFWQYKVNEDRIGLDFFLIPRITYQIRPRVLLDLNIPFSLLEYQYKIEYYKNSHPNSGALMTTTLNSQSPGNSYYLRIGVGLSI